MLAVGSAAPEVLNDMDDLSWLGERPRVIVMVAPFDQVRDRVISVLREEPTISNVQSEDSGRLITAALRTTWATRAGRIRLVLTPRGDGVQIEANVRIPHGIVGLAQVKSDELLHRLFDRLRV